MRAIETLMHEHRIIQHVLVALDTYADAVERGNDPPLSDLAMFVEFIREFADRCHHGKEEGILFAEMVEHGFSDKFGPIAVMLQEHTIGRAYVAAMAGVLESPEWTPQVRQAVVANARGYVELLASHIRKEDEILYPIALAHLPGAAIDGIADRFDAFEANEMGAGTHERFHELAHELAERYAPNGATATA